MLEAVQAADLIDQSCDFLKVPSIRRISAFSPLSHVCWIAADAPLLSSLVKPAKPIYFLHVHKAAGSSLVRFAEDSGIKIFVPAVNGNPVDDSGHRLKLWLYSSSKWAQFSRQKLQPSGFQFFANEEFLGKDFWRILPLFDFVTILRDPADRWLSDYFHQCEDRSMPTAESLIAGLPDLPPRVVRTLRPNNLCLQLTFPRASHWPAKTLSSEAIARLKHFRLIMFQSTLDADIHHFAQFAGVPSADSPQSNRRQRLIARDYLSPELYARLCHFHQSDYGVYNYFWQARLGHFNGETALGSDGAPARAITAEPHGVELRDAHLEPGLNCPSFDKPASRLDLLNDEIIDLRRGLDDFECELERLRHMGLRAAFPNAPNITPTP